MKKIIFFFVIVLAIFGFSACKIQGEKVIDVGINKAVEVQESGTTINITDKNFQIVYARPGDILELNFVDTKNSQNQWSFRSPIQKEIVSRVKPGEILNSWKLKILKNTNFELLFSYENAIKTNTPLKTFRVEIIVDKSKNDIPDIMVNSPKSDDAVGQKFIINGYSKSNNKNIFYTITNTENKTILEGRLTVPTDSSYFEKNIDLKKGVYEKGVLKIYQVNEGDTMQYNSTTIPISFKNPQ